MSDAKKTCARVRSFLSFESCCLLTSWTAGATGQELDQYLNKHRQSTDTDYDRVVYIGDGSNDFCAVLRLRRYFTFFFPLFYTILFLGQTVKTLSSAVDSAASSAKSQKNAPKAQARASGAQSSIGLAHGRSRKSSRRTLNRHPWMLSIKRSVAEWSVLIYKLRFIENRNGMVIGIPNLNKMLLSSSPRKHTRRDGAN